MRGGESTSCERAKTGLLAPRRPPRRGTETLRAECAHAPSHRTPRSRRRTLCACPCPALTTHKLRQLSARPKTKRGATKTVASWAVASGVGLRAPCRAGPSSPCQSWRTSSASVPAHAQAEVSSRSALGSAHPPCPRAAQSTLRAQRAVGLCACGGEAGEGGRWGARGWRVIAGVARWSVVLCVCEDGPNRRRLQLLDFARWPARVEVGRTTDPAAERAFPELMHDKRKHVHGDR